MTAIILNQAETFREAMPVTVRTGGGYRPDGSMRLPAIVFSIAIPAAILAALALANPYVGTKEKAPQLLTFDVISRAPPPAPPPPKDTAAPVLPPKAEIVTPPPQVRVATPPAQSVATTEAAATVTQPAQVRAAPVAPPAPPAPPAPTGPVSVGNLTSKLIGGAPPVYPVEARRKRETGTVVLRLVLAADGRLTSIAVYKSSGVDKLDTAALEAVRKWRWSPTLRDGTPVEVTGLVQIPFVLKNS